MKKILATAALIAAGAVAVSASSDLPGQSTTPTATINWMPEAEVAAKLQVMGYTVIEIEREDGRSYEARMRDANGFEVEAYLDAETGELLRHSDDDRRAERDDD